MTVRSDAQQKHKRVFALVVEMDVDRCANVYGSAPCTAAAGVGNECYNTYASCQDKANFTRTTTAHKLCSGGVVVPGETTRPYVIGNAAITPTEIVPSKGLAMRSQTSITMVDEPALDHLEDPYWATRATPAQGTWWGRLMARNPNIVGRPARVRRGYVQSPWSWDTFQTELFLVDAVRGPNEQGRVTLVLSDILKIADRNVVPAPTAGKLQAPLKVAEFAGLIVSATATTVELPDSASALDDAYNGMELYITQGTGQGQRRVVTDYVGATRICTVAAWAEPPAAGSGCQVAALSVNVGSGLGAQYTDPATSGKPEFVRVGDEIIRYTAKTGDVLSWADTSHRAQWGTTAGDHDAADAVQLCRAWVGKRVWEVLRDIFVEAGISASYLDLAPWEAEDATYLNGAEITICISEPEKASALAGELLVDVNAVSWWAPVEQKVRFLVNQPRLPGTAAALTDDDFILGSTKVEVLDTERITSAAVYYGPRNYTAAMEEARNYQAATMYVDGDAQSPNEYGDTRQDTRYSRWLSGANGIFASAVVARRLARLRDAPVKVSAKLDPRSEKALGEQVTVTTRRLQGVNGAPRTLQARVVRAKDAGAHFECTFLSTGFKRSRYAFIAPNGQPDYLAASADQRRYAYIATTSTGRMSNGDEGYYIS